MRKACIAIPRGNLTHDQMRTRNVEVLSSVLGLGIPKLWRSFDKLLDQNNRIVHPRVQLKNQSVEYLPQRGPNAEANLSIQREGAVELVSQCGIVNVQVRELGDGYDRSRERAVGHLKMPT